MEERLLSLLRLAIKYKVSDIHFAMSYSEVSIQMRINGYLKKVKSEFIDTKLIRYLQYLSGLDVGQLLDAQTGGFEMYVDDKRLSLRFSVVNTVNETNGVLRILNPDLKQDADHLSLDDKQNEFFKNILKRQCGLVIFSGPTGSGKTTTLYTLLKSIKNKKVYSLEDPIEVDIKDIIQLQINEKIGFDYAEGIKHILRHDPDVIMIGEIRDAKAAKWAVNAANTGHLVFATIHASKASSVISRLVELGVNESSIYENLLALINQRMILKENNEKAILYEIMDEEEINYFRKNKENSKRFESVTKQLVRGINEGKIKEFTK